MDALHVNSEMILKKDEIRSKQNEDGTSLTYLRLLHKSSGRCGSVMIKSSPSSQTEQLEHMVMHKSNKAPKSTNIIQGFYLHGKGVGLDVDVLQALASKFSDLHIQGKAGKSRPVVTKCKKSLKPVHSPFRRPITKITLRTGEYLKKTTTTERSSDAWQFYDASGNSISSVHLFPQDGGSVSVCAPKLSRRAFLKVLRALEKYYALDESGSLEKIEQKICDLQKSMSEFPARYTLKQLTWIRNLKKILEDTKAPADPLSDHRATGVLRKFRQKWWHLLISGDETKKIQITPPEAADYEQDRQRLQAAINELSQSGDESLVDSMPPTVNALAIF
jgi:hypothetical protein